MRKEDRVWDASSVIVRFNIDDVVGSDSDDQEKDGEVGGPGWAAIGFAEALVLEEEAFPNTRRSNSASDVDFIGEKGSSEVSVNMRSEDCWEVEKPFVDVEARSLSLRVCCCSIFEDKFLIKSMYSLNCCKLSSGPRLKDHKIGSTSMARNSQSAILPTCRKTLRAVIMTAG